MGVSILFRRDQDTESEFQEACKHLHVSENRVGLIDSLVCGRFSVLPFYQELEEDLKLQNSRLINTYQQHKYIADFEYYHDVAEFTPKTYFDFVSVPNKGPFVVKGKTNSRKFEWKTKMFAETKRDAINLALDLQADALIERQGTLIREFVPLKILEEGINGLPFANEWRFFYLGNQRIAHNFYWTISETVGTIDQEGMDFAQKIAEIMALKTNFFVIDIAEKADGGWILIEANDGQMSGLSGIDAEKFYTELADNLSRFSFVLNMRKKV